MQSIVERMFRAKWITGTNLVTPDNWRITLTDLGRQRIGKVCDALIEVDPDFFKAEDTSVLTKDMINQPSAVQLLMFLVKVAPIVAELQPPPLPDEERDTLIGMFLLYARAKGKGQSPPTRGYGAPGETSRPDTLR